MFTRLLIANRGEIAQRIIRTARRLGVETVAVYSDADAAATHVKAADRAIRLGPGPAAESYLCGDKIIAAARASGAQAIHPGYGFLSENAAFAEAVAAAGLVFVGPRAEAIRRMGLKDGARRLAASAGAPVIPGYDGADQEPARLAAEAAAIGYPVMIKARAGGGGKGMRAVADPAAFGEALAAAQREAEASFGDGSVLIEKQILRPRHLEVQVFGDAHGGLVHLFERDCSLQRRHQKVIEEAPAPGVDAPMRAALTQAALNVARAVDYVGAGTVEFIADASAGLSPDQFYFLEMNTRLQVEHPVTEAVTGLDLVEWQLRVAAGEALPRRQEDIALDGWAVEARLYAEDPARDFAPSTGRFSRLRLPEQEIRVDAGVTEGDAVTPYYDPMIAKAIAWAPGRGAAFGRLARALDGAAIGGVASNLELLARLLRHETVLTGAVETGLIAAEIGALTADEAPSALVTALGAIAALGLAPGLVAAPPLRGYDPWRALTGYRAWGAATQVIHLSAGETRIRAAVTPLAARDGARARFQCALGAEDEGDPFEVSLERDDAGRFRFESGGWSGLARLDRDATPDGVGALVSIEGARARFFAADPLARRAAAAGPSGDAALAPMPGVVTAVLVVAGEVVEAGQTMAEMEAMKMALTVPAPRAGVVAALEAAPGDQLEDGAVVARLAPADPEDETK